MDEYIRREDAVYSINVNADDLEQNGCIPYAQGARAMAIVVEWIPPADVVQVVRCKNCKYSEIQTFRGSVEWLCFYNGVNLRINPDDFCCWGARREE